MFHDGFMGGMWFGWIFWIAIFGLVIYLIVRLTNQRGSKSDNSNESPLDTLKKRYARGEITKEEFDSMKKDLQ